MPRDEQGAIHQASATGRAGRRCGRSARVDPRRKGVILLEVLLSVTLFVLGAAAVGAALHNAHSATMGIRARTRAVNLAQSVLAELASAAEIVDVVPSEFVEETEDGETVVIAEGWTYEIQTEELTDLVGLLSVTVIVRNDDAYRPTVYRVTQWMLDPAADAEEAIEEAGL